MKTQHGTFAIVPVPDAGETLYRIEPLHIDGVHLVYGWQFRREATALKFAQRMEHLLRAHAARGYATRGTTI